MRSAQNPVTPERQRWRPDDERANCEMCHKAFSLFRRRHHCRQCGDIFCSACCGEKVAGIPGYRQKRERACIRCRGTKYLTPDNTRETRTLNATALSPGSTQLPGALGDPTVFPLRTSETATAVGGTGDAYIFGHRFRDTASLVGAFTQAGTRRARLAYLGSQMLNAALARLIIDGHAAFDEAAVKKRQEQLLSDANLNSASEREAVWAVMKRLAREAKQDVNITTESTAAEKATSIRAVFGLMSLECSWDQYLAHVRSYFLA